MIQNFFGRTKLFAIALMLSLTFVFAGPATAYDLQVETQPPDAGASSESGNYNLQGDPVNGTYEEQWAEPDYSEETVDTPYYPPEYEESQPAETEEDMSAAQSPPALTETPEPTDDAAMFWQGFFKGFHGGFTNSFFIASVQILILLVLAVYVFIQTGKHPFKFKGLSRKIAKIKITRPRITKTWLTLGIVAVVTLILYLAVYFWVTPRVTAWFESKFPEAFAVQKALITEYPDRNIEATDQTFYSGSNSGSTERVLIINVVGKKHLESGDKDEIGNTICSELGQDAQKFNTIVIQSVDERRFLMFYSRQIQSDTFNC